MNFLVAWSSSTCIVAVFLTGLLIFRLRSTAIARHLLCLVLMTTPGVVWAQIPAWLGVQAVSTTTGQHVNFGSTAINAAGDVFVSGYFAGQVSFGNTTLTSQGISDLFVAKWNTSSRTWAWAVDAGSAGNNTLGYGLAVSDLNVYVTGWFSGTVSISGTSLTSVGPQDMFVAKYIDGGNTALNGWAVRAGQSSMYGLAIAVSGTSVYVTGSFYGTPTVGNTLLISRGALDMFIAKYVDNGSSASNVWCVQGGGNATDEAYGIALNGTSIYVTGYFANTASIGNTTLTNSNLDMFVAKYEDYGNMAGGRWAVQGGATIMGRGFGIAVNGSSVYVTGGFSGTATISGATLTSQGGADVFVTKYTDNGISAGSNWAIAGGGAADDEGRGIAVNGADIYATGYFSGTGTISNTNLVSNGLRDAFAAKYVDNGGNVGSAGAVGGGGPGFRNVLSLSDYDTGNSIAINGGNVYVGGIFYSSPGIFGGFSLPGNTTTYNSFLTTLTNTITANASILLTAQLQLYPNPTTDVMRVVRPAAWGKVEVKLFNSIGQLVQRVSLAAAEQNLNLQALPVGMYTLRLMSAQGVISKPFVRQ